VPRCSTTTSAFYNTRTITTGAEVSLWIWQQYLDTNDLSFLRQNFPLMAAAAQFLLSYTTGATDGLLHTYPSNAHESQWDVHDPTTDIAAETARDCGRRIAHQAHADPDGKRARGPVSRKSQNSTMYYSKQHVGDRGSVDQDSLGKQATEVASSGGLDVLAKPLANGDVSVVLFNENSSTATISTTAGAISKTGASSYTLTNLWTGATSTTTGGIRPTPRGPR
jgi:Alpha galactosidase C-terminal beta sandwich domain